MNANANLATDKHTIADTEFGFEPGMRVWALGRRSYRDNAYFVRAFEVTKVLKRRLELVELDPDNDFKPTCRHYEATRRESRWQAFAGYRLKGYSGHGLGGVIVGEGYEAKRPEPKLVRELRDAIIHAERLVEKLNDLGREYQRDFDFDNLDADHATPILEALKAKLEEAK